MPWLGGLRKLKSNRPALGERREALSAQRTRAEAALAEMRQGHDAAAMAQQAEDALAAARDAAERYARLHVARVLLRPASTGSARSSRGRCCGRRGGISPC